MFATVVLERQMRKGIMRFKEVEYDYSTIIKTLDKKGHRTKEDPVAVFSNELKDRNVIYFFYNSDQCLYVGETDTSLWDRIVRHEPPEKNKDWFKRSNKIKIIVLDEKIDKYTRKNLESCFIVNLLRAGHELCNLQ